jgi:NAD(P)-dependent dehydrogenase (short-subunit alcohol dehydrogenase family)
MKIDHVDADAATDTFLRFDLARLGEEREYLLRALDSVSGAIGNRELRALINNAAVQIVKPIGSLDSQDWRATLSVNLLAPFLLSQALLEKLERGRGSIINIASIHASLTKPGFAAYATSKAALVGLTRSLAVELGSRVRVNAIAPAAVSTRMLQLGLGSDQQLLKALNRTHPMGRIAAAEEVAQAACFLASDKAAFVTGSVFQIDGGIGARLHDPV